MIYLINDLLDFRDTFIVNKKINITLRLNKTEPVVDEPVTKEKRKYTRKTVAKE